MAINRVDAPNPLPLTTADYQAQNNLIDTNFLTVNSPIEFGSGNIFKGAVLYVGGTTYIADSDTAITGTTSDYVKITPSGATASASYVVDLTGVSWNDTYNGYYDVSGNLYIFDEGNAIETGELTVAKTKIGKAAEFNIKSDDDVLRVKTVQIGDWNMDSTATVSVSLGLPVSDDNIRLVNAVIIRDGSAERYSFGGGPEITGAANQSIKILGGSAVLTRTTGGFYDNTNFNQISFNRGWVTVTYEV